LHFPNLVVTRFFFVGLGFFFVGRILNGTVSIVAPIIMTTTSFAKTAIG
jgi:hypothetical protein